MSKDVYVLLTVAVIWLTATTPPSCNAAMMTQVDVVAISGDPLPGGGSRTVGQTGGGVINDNGDVAFFTTFDENGVHSGSAVMRGNRNSVTLIARSGQPRGDGLGTYSGFSHPFMNSGGQLSFQAFTLRDSDGRQEEIVYVTEVGTDTPQIVAQEFAATPGGGIFLDISSEVLINDGGAVSFVADRTGFGTPRGVYFGDANSLAQVDVGSVGARTILNDAGHLAFDETISFSPGNNALFYYDGVNVMELARGGDSVSGSTETFTGTFASFSRSLNEAGKLAFVARVSPTTDSLTDDRLFVYDPATAISEPVPHAVTAPDGNGEFDDFGIPFLNNNDLLAFAATLENTTRGIGDDEGIFLTDTSGSFVQQIARKGETLPSGSGFFTNFRTTLAMNDNDQIVFWAEVQDATSTCVLCDSLYFHDPSLGLVELIREGDELLGSPINRVFGEFTSDIAKSGTDEGRAINNNGEVVFSFLLEDGRRGIAIVTLVPEPGSAVLVFVMIACVCASCSRRQVGTLSNT